MNLLLDTCSLLWALQDADQLSADARRALLDPANTISVSVVSFWEIGLKSGLGKLVLHQATPEDIPRFVEESGWTIHPLSPATAAGVGRLPRPSDHRDPFDRLLVWTAIHEGFSLVSGDDALPHYVPHGLKICW
ncbi:type II toxin-antitoxin system VapC family toxin [Opitutales bacterium ASA1]|uniref:type II toxin-antitoxin system VapC family toxin n=1 Tax=Congregicoccus parvus TaxID=3081749 RepID=UPI002B2A2DA9|nr:type II toxin-antitoxin system VapC family toxin [Opitutales bacterium ASA1]